MDTKQSATRIIHSAAELVTCQSPDGKRGPRTGAAQEGHFLLGGLEMVREKLAAACKWPHAAAKSRN